METYDKLRKLCESRNIKMSEMARGAGIRNSVLTELKMGRTRQLSVPTLEKIAAFFDVGVAQLLADDAPEEGEAADKRRLLYEMSGQIPEDRLDDLLRLMREFAEKDGKHDEG